jgi:hypothetical protein
MSESGSRSPPRPLPRPQLRPASGASGEDPRRIIKDRVPPDAANSRQLRRLG